MIKYLKEESTVDGKLNKALFFLALSFFIVSPSVIYLRVAVKELSVIGMIAEAIIGTALTLVLNVTIFKMVKSKINFLDSRIVIFGAILNILLS